ncbi:hypothetical protein [Brevibacterium limosum]|nr:hypothetical protein [Brevibacterium limosum]
MLTVHTEGFDDARPRREEIGQNGLEIGHDRLGDNLILGMTR